VGDFQREEEAQILANRLMKEGLSPLVVCAD
jgi:hypothetical protein